MEPSKKPSVLFIASQPFYQWRGSPIRLGFDVMGIVQNGCDVDFLTLPIGERREIPGARIIRAPNVFRARNISIGPSPLKLCFDVIMFFQALGMICRRHYDLVHGVEDCGLFAWVLGRLAGGGVIFEKHSDSGSYKKGLIIRIYAAVERFVIRHADAVICTGPGLVEQAKGLGGNAFHVSDIPSSLEEPEADGVKDARARLGGKDGEIVATYVGSFASYQGIDLLFHSMPPALRKERNLRYAVIGGTPEEIARWGGWLASEGVADRVTFVGKVPPDALPCYLAASDILLSPRIAGVNTPLKILDYLKVSRAIVATDHEANRLLLDEGTAVFARIDADSFADATASLAGDGAARERLSANCRKLIDEKYNFSVFRDGLKACYASVLAKRPAK